MLIQVFGTILSIFFLAALFIAFGRVVLRFVYGNYQNFPFFLRLGFNYFFGTAFFLALWRVSAFFSGSASLSFYFSLIIILSASLFVLRGNIRKLRQNIPNFSLRKFLLPLGLLVLVMFFELALWLQVLPIPTDPFDNFGSAHPVRYTNIAEYIFVSDKIPVLNQNFAQSMLAVAPRFLGFAKPFVVLNIFLSLSVFALLLTMYGVFSYFGMDKKRAVFSTFLFMLGNTALSFTHVLSLDSNNPFLMSSYIDATCGVGTFLILLFLLFEIHSNNGKALKNWLMVPIVLGIYWNFSGAQNIILAALLLLGICAVYVLKNRSFKHKIFALTFIFGVSAFFSLSQGGMLTPKMLRTKVSIPGLASTERQGEYTGIKPELPFAYGYSRDWQYGNPYDPLEKEMYVQILRKGGTFLSLPILHKIIWRLETNFWLALRVMFFPLVGLMAFYFLRKKITDFNFQNSEFLKKLWEYAVWVFASGFVFAFSIIISGRKWEMSRFMIMPYALGLILFIFTFHYFSKTIYSKYKTAFALGLITVIMTFGPIVNAGVIIHRNFKNLDLAGKKLNYFVQNPGLLGRELWQEWIKKGLVKE